MSTILKALKKLEERKAADGRRRGDIAWDILREDQPRCARDTWPLYLVVVALVALFLAVLVWQLLPHRLEQRVEPLAPTAARENVPPAVQKGELPGKQPEVRTRPAIEDTPGMDVMIENPVLPVTPVPPDAPLTVSGIAYQDEAEARLAIVNDLPVMVGTMIEGFVIERIETDRVVFSRGGKLYSIGFPPQQ